MLWLSFGEWLTLLACVAVILVPLLCDSGLRSK